MHQSARHGARQANDRQRGPVVRLFGGAVAICGLRRGPRQRGAQGASQPHVARLEFRYNGRMSGGIFGTWFDGWSLSDKIAVIASVVAFLQFIALIATVFVMRRTAQRQLRAYVMIKSVRIDNVIIGGKPEVLITLRNSGQTPAREVTHWAKLVFSTFPEISELMPGRDVRETLPTSFIAPGGKLRLNTGIDLPLNGPTIKAIADQSHALYVKGEVRYVDAFGVKRATDFFLFCTGALAANGTMASYKSGNRVT
jgi:hypothetical protein